VDCGLDGFYEPAELGIPLASIAVLFLIVI